MSIGIESSASDYHNFKKAKGNGNDWGHHGVGISSRCVLVVDDDPTMRRMVSHFLQDHNLQVLAAAGREEMSCALAQSDVDLLILDLKLGNDDGLDLLREIRAQSDVPIIIVTGYRRNEIDRVVGLELGADDYLTKPVNLRELLARIRAVLRRHERAETAPDRSAPAKRYQFAGWELNPRTRRLTSPAGEQIALSRGEYGLLMAFLDAPQRVLSREQLLAATRLHDGEVFDRSIDVQILRLRRKLEADPSIPTIIKTERGVGYLFAAAVHRIAR
jgi:two-component system, OmpR family, response regulator